MKYETQKTEAIVLFEKEMGEADKLFILYTKEFGKIEVLGKSVRRARAKLRGGLQSLNYISLEFVEGKNFFIATDAVLKEDFSNIKSDHKRYRAALYACRLLDELTKEEGDRNVWKLINMTLKDLNELENINSRFALILRFFEWNLLSFLGFKPELYSCILCEEKIKLGKFFFSLVDGGIVCEKCFKAAELKEAKARQFAVEFESPLLARISRDAIKILRLAVGKNREVILRLKINEDQEKELKDVSKKYIEYILEEEIFVV